MFAYVDDKVKVKALGVTKKRDLMNENDNFNIPKNITFTLISYFQSKFAHEWKTT